MISYINYKNVVLQVFKICSYRYIPIQDNHIRKTDFQRYTEFTCKNACKY